MHITLETDYAIRIVDYLARNQGRIGAKTIAERSHITLRFSLKILRKLVASGIARSFKGAQGGYELARSLDEISLNDIVETIEGPYMLNRCLRDDSVCTRTGDKNCPYHYFFEYISKKVEMELKAVTMAQVIVRPDQAARFPDLCQVCVTGD